MAFRLTSPLQSISQIQTEIHLSQTHFIFLDPKTNMKRQSYQSGLLFKYTILINLSHFTVLEASHLGLKKLATASLSMVTLLTLK